MRRHNNKLVMLAAAAVWLFSPFAIAQDDASTDSTITVDAQPLATALKDFSDQTGLQLAYVATLAENKSSNGVENAATPVDALDAILDDTGLEYQFVNDETIAIGAAADRRGSSDSKNLSPTPVLMAQVANGQVKTTASSQSEENEVSVVAGKVTDARTGANLKGAKVTIEETGQWTSTDDLGEFRFVGVMRGRATLVVSYLGYAEQSASIGVRGDSVVHNFALRGGSELEEIIVFGQRSARAQALNLERTAENSKTVVSADLLGNFSGTTLSESLRRVPGVSFVQDFAQADGSNTGDGTNIVIRGLAPDLNTIRFNGIELPEGNAQNRTATLSNILSDSIESVTISQTLLANQDSGGVGGLVEIETFSALDRPDRFARFSAEVRDRDGDFLEDSVYTGQVSGRFGEDKNLGVGLSVEFRDRTIRSIQAGTPRLIFGDYLPLDSEGNPTFRQADDVPPGNPFPFFDTEGGSSVYPQTFAFLDSITDTETTSFGVNVAWDWADHSVLRFDYRRLDDDVRSRSSNYTISDGSSYAVRPVLEFGGQELRALSDRFDLRPSLGLTFQDIDTERSTDILTLRGDTAVGRMSFDYTLGYTEGTFDRPFFGSLSLFAPGASLGWDPDLFIDPALVDAVEGIYLTSYLPLRPDNESIPLPQYTEAGFANINRQEVYTGVSGTLSRFSGANERVSAELGGRYDFPHENLKYVEFGIDYERSTANSTRVGGGEVNLDAASSLADFGVPFDLVVLEDIGINSQFQTFSSSAASNIIRDFRAFESNGLISISDIEMRDDIPGVVGAEETEYASYVQIRYDIGKLELIGGVRYSVLEVQADDLDFVTFTDENFQRDPEFEAATTVFRTESVTQRAWLVRGLANYRFNEYNVLRLGYFQAIARPQLQLISDRRSFSLNLGLTRFGLPGSLFIQQGNPDLESARTDSYDLSFEHYTKEGGAFKASLFYKNIENLTEQNQIESADVLEGVVLPDFSLATSFPDGLDLVEAAQAGDINVTLRQPQNNPNDANIWGVQVSAEQQFTWWPGLWSGFGVYGNYTYTDSDLTRTLNFTDGSEDLAIEIDGIRFSRDPRHSGTIAGTYNAYGFDAALLYTYQGRTESGFRVNGLSEFLEPVDSLDFVLGYIFDVGRAQVQLNFDVSDILRDPEDPASMTSSGDNVTYIRDRAYRGGREFRLGLIATF